MIHPKPETVNPKPWEILGLRQGAHIVTGVGTERGRMSGPALSGRVLNPIELWTLSPKAEFQSLRDSVGLEAGAWQDPPPKGD